MIFTSRLSFHAPGEICQVGMQKGSKILSVDKQLPSDDLRFAASLWYQLPGTTTDQLNDYEQRFFAAYQTGQGTPPPHAVYVGTVCYLEGQYVLHIFDVTEPK